MCHLDHMTWLFANSMITIKRLEDSVAPSVTIRTETAAAWLIGMESTEYLCNAILALTHPALFDARVEAIYHLQHHKDVPNVKTHSHVSLWRSVFSGIGVIVNRKTPRHRDSGGCTQWYDLLVSAGTHESSTINVPELGATFSYSPGTIFMVCGKLLSHSVDRWEGGECICVAHFMRNMLHERLGIHRPQWNKFHTYKKYFDKGFKEVQRWQM
jgi:hypothetical protein